MRAFLSLPIPVSGHIKVQHAGSDKQLPAVAAAITVPSLDFQLNERSSTSSTGRYHLWVPPGEWEVEIEVQTQSGATVKKLETLKASGQGEQKNIILKL